MDVLEELKGESYQDFMLSQVKANWAGILQTNIARLKAEHVSLAEMVASHQKSHDEWAVKADRLLKERHAFEAKHIADLDRIKGGLDPKFQKEITRYFGIIRELQEAEGMRDQQRYWLRIRTPELERLKLKIEALEAIKNTPVDELDNRVFLQFVQR